MLTLCNGSRADEGLWLYNHPPRQAIREKYGFELTDAWLKHLQLSSVRFGGASGEFVSAAGLILSNHHVGSRALQRLSTIEIVKLTDSLTALVEGLGYNHPVVREVLDGLSPHQRAVAAVGGTKLALPATRRQWYEGGLQALDQAQDPMLALARRIDGEARAVRQEVEARREAIRQAHAQIGKARYALVGAGHYPDATGTLRLSYGVVAGYEEDGRPIPFQTTFTGLYQRAASQNCRPPFDLPQRWLANENKLSPATPFNFVCTADIIGGNSGSPVVNRRGEFAGLIFDGNIQSLVADFLYTEDQARAVCVHSSAIIEALENLYEARPLAKELMRGRE
jgi:hypothetical protein